MKLYKEIMLLALKDEEGTLAPGYIEQITAGAVMADLLFEGRIGIDDTRKQLVHLENPSMTGDTVLDAAIDQMKDAKKPRSLNKWLHAIANIKDLRHIVARQLVDDGILKAEEKKVLLLFKQRVYPEVNPAPEQALMERLRTALFEQGEVDERTAVLIALAGSGYLLPHLFDRKQVRQHKERIEAIIEGSVVGEATQEVIMGLQAAQIATSVVVTAT